MSKSQMLDRQITKISDNFVCVKYVYLYVNNKEDIEKHKGDLKGFHPIGKAVHGNLKHDGKYIGWTWEQMYQKD